MAGLSSIGVYLPRSVVPQGDGVRRVANADEDTLTLAVEAAHRCLEEVEPLTFGGLFFASVSSPFRETPLSSVVATACDLPRDIVTADFSGSTKAGLSALTAAVRAVEGGVRRVLVVSADCRRDGGADGAVAAVVDAKGRLCEFLASAAVAEDFGFQSPEPAAEPNRPLRDLAEVVERVINEYGVGPDELSALAVGGASADVLVRLAGLAAVDPTEHLVTAYASDVGALGSPEPLFRLAAAVERGRVGDRVLVAAGGHGAEAALFQLNDGAGAEACRPSLAQALRAPLPSAPAGRVGPAQWDAEPESGREGAPDPRTSERNTRLYGTRCAACGAVEFPETAECGGCGTKEGLEPAKLTKQGSVASVDSEAGRAIVDLDGGGRLSAETTDGAVGEPTEGARVRLTLRRGSLDGPARYVWKVRLDA